MKKVNFITLVASIGFTMIACNTQPNDKLKIDGKEYTISLGEINLEKSVSDAVDSLTVLTIEVLADGKPMPNIKQYTQTTLNIGEYASSSTYEVQPVKMSLDIKGRRIFPNEVLMASENGIFKFYVEEMPDIIAVYAEKKEVYFNAKTKEIMSSKEYDRSFEEWAAKNRAELGMD